MESKASCVGDLQKNYPEQGKKFSTISLGEVFAERTGDYLGSADFR